MDKIQLASGRFVEVGDTVILKAMGGYRVPYDSELLIVEDDDSTGYYTYPEEMTVQRECVYLWPEDFE